MCLPCGLVPSVQLGGVTFRQRTRRSHKNWLHEQRERVRMEEKNIEFVIIVEQHENPLSSMGQVSHRCVGCSLCAKVLCWLFCVDVLGERVQVSFVTIRLLDTQWTVIWHRYRSKFLFLVLRTFFLEQLRFESNQLNLIDTRQVQGYLFCVILAKLMSKKSIRKERISLT